MRTSAFPDFYVIGAAKAGTTTLVDMLGTHERVWFPHEKEPHHFFLREDDRAWTIRDGRKVKPLADVLPYAGENEYLGLYARAPDNVLRGDASTQYLVNATTARAIHAERPDAKIIVVLRHPTDRAYSAYVHARSRGEDGCATFASAISECEAGSRETSFAINYLAEGDYARHLKRYQELFGENLLVVFFEDLVEQPQSVFDQMTAFLSIPQQGLSEAEASHKNAGIELGNPVSRAFRITAKRIRRMAPGLFELPLFRKPYEILLATIGRKPEKLAPEMRSHLDAHYASHIESLETLLGRKLPNWHR